MRDMIPHGERSIRSIPVPANHRRARETMYEETDRPRRPRRSRRFFVVAGIVAVVCAIVGVLLSTLFAGATVVVYPRTQAASLPATVDASLNASAGTLAYQSITMTRSASTSMDATGSAKVSRQAVGQITIYNNYSTASQRLIANTRFAASDGKIYRVRDSVVVPGQIKGASGQLTAGSVTASIFADSPGTDYNKSGSERFTVPGFKGDPRYDKFFAQSSGAISGGFVGDEPTVSQSDLQKAQTALEQALQGNIEQDMVAQVPEGYIFVPGTLKVNFSGVTKTLNGNKAIVGESAVAVGVVVRSDDLASAIARKAVTGYSGEAVGFREISDITIGLATTSTKSGNITLSLSGTPMLVWQFDPAAIKQALLGKPKGQFQSIVESFKPAIAKADAKIRPFWSGDFPKDPGKITVTQQLPK